MFPLQQTDFGTAKNLEKEASEGRGRTNSFVGTADYVPPEVLTKPSESGADDSEPLITTAADLWSLGCILYQMLTGRYPVRGKSEMLTFNRIKSRDVYIPPNMPPAAADLLNRLLVLDPAARLGANCDFAGLRAHPFFAGITFDGLWTQDPPPFAPFPFALDWSGAPSDDNTSTSGDGNTGGAAHAAAATAAVPAAVPAAAAVEGDAATSPAPEQAVDEAATREYQAFLKPGEDVLLARGVQRLYPLRAKRQMLLLTSTPRIVLLSAGDGAPQRVVKEIPWSMSLSFGVLKDPTKFFVQCGKSRKKFKDLEHNASKALTAFEDVMRRYRESAVPDQ